MFIAHSWHLGTRLSEDIFLIYVRYALLELVESIFISRCHTFIFSSQNVDGSYSSIHYTACE